MTSSSGVGGAPVTGQEAETEVIALLKGFRREAASSGAPTYAAEIIRCVREAAAAEIKAAAGASLVPGFYFNGFNAGVRHGADIALSGTRRGR